MKYLYFLLLPLLSCTKVTMQGFVTKARTSEKRSASFWLNGWMFLFSFLILTALFLREIPSIQVLLMAVISAALTFCFQTSYVMAFSTGPVGLTCILVSLNNVVKILYAAFRLGEHLSVVNWVGAALTFLPMFLISKPDKNSKVNAKWLFFTLLAFFSVAANDIFILSLIHAGWETAATKQVVIVSYLFAAAFSFLLVLILPHGDFAKGELGLRFFVLTAACAAALGLYNLFLTQALFSIAASVLYPVIGALVTAFSTLSDVVIFKQRPSLRQYCGIVLAAVSVVMINL